MSSLWNKWSGRDETDRIFISYRRSDTSGFAGRLEDTLKAYFGKRRVFRDVGAIEPGVDFLEETEKSRRSTAVLIVLIGPGGLSLTGMYVRERRGAGSAWALVQVVKTRIDS